MKLSGFSSIIATASPHNNELPKTIGATLVLDRNLSPEALYTVIKKITDKPFLTIYGAVGAPATQNLGYDLLAPGGTLAIVRQDMIEPEKKVPEKGVISVYGDVNFPQNRKFGAALYAKLTELLADGLLKVCRCSQC